MTWSNCNAIRTGFGNAHGGGLAGSDETAGLQAAQNRHLQVATSGHDMAPFARRHARRSDGDVVVTARSFEEARRRRCHGSPLLQRATQQTTRTARWYAFNYYIYLFNLRGCLLQMFRYSVSKVCTSTRNRTRGLNEGYLSLSGRNTSFIVQ